jgi:hypothetical protein
MLVIRVKQIYIYTYIYISIILPWAIGINQTWVVYYFFTNILADSKLYIPFIKFGGEVVKANPLVPARIGMVPKIWPCCNYHLVMTNIAMENHHF